MPAPGPVREDVMLVVNSRIRIPPAELEFTYARSSGPGGQNVNKVSSKALLRWNVTGSPSLPADVRERFLKKNTSRLTTEGDILITSQRLARSVAQRGRLPGEAAGHAAAGRHGARTAQADAPHSRVARTTIGA